MRAADLAETELRELLAFAEELADLAAAAVLPYFRAPIPVENKAIAEAPYDPVTAADRAAEQVIRAHIMKTFPAHGIFGEEFGWRRGESRWTWVIDPIDGTANFTADLPLFGTMLALVEGDRILAGFIHDPIGDDTAVAVAGGGAWRVLPDGERISLRTAPPVPVSRMTGALSWRFLGEPLKSRVISRMSRLGSSFDLRCAAHQYRMLAAGHCHTLLFRKTLPWDHCAGVLLVTEAGGYAARYDGRPYLPSDTGGGLLVAPDPASWQELRKVLLEE
jgi:fructose-1,6-bisphosphatase/inositol monophosphatase family enzyme